MLEDFLMHNYPSLRYQNGLAKVSNRYFDKPSILVDAGVWLWRRTVEGLVLKNMCALKNE